MTKYLVNTTEVYRVDTMAAVEALQAAVKADSRYEVASFTYKAKNKKLKGEIIDEWYQVSVKKIFNDEKDPYTEVSVDYEVG
jgi:hypothetical protein